MASYQFREKEIKNSFAHVVAIPYCDAQHILTWATRTGYTAGVYGWKSDIYVFAGHDLVISTGYGPIGTKYPEIVTTFENAARDIHDGETGRALLNTFIQALTIAEINRARAAHGVPELLPIPTPADALAA